MTNDKSVKARSGVRDGLDPAGRIEVQYRKLSELRPATVNDQIYGVVNPDDMEVQKLSWSIRDEGVKTPLHVTLDNVIVSGHRRRTACYLAGVTLVPVIVEPYLSTDPKFIDNLVAANLQRIKTAEQRIREAVATIDPAEARRNLIARRNEQSAIKGEFAPIEAARKRSKIGKGAQEFLETVQTIIAQRRAYWPLSDRQIHYALLNTPPLKNTAKPDSRYGNTLNDYKRLCDLLTCARLEGLIGMHVIADETRPVSDWNLDPNAPAFAERSLAWFLRGYRRDLLQSQPNHIEVVGEKNTVAGILKPVAERYCVPITIARGFCSIPPRYALAQRFKRSGKDKLILLVCSDLDPDGEQIFASFVRSMRDDFNIPEARILPRKVALTAEQVEKYSLPASMIAKEGSSNYQKFVDRYDSKNAYELEALPPDLLEAALTEAIESVIDRVKFNEESEAEALDAQWLEAQRRIVFEALGRVEREPEAEPVVPEIQGDWSSSAL